MDCDCEECRRIKIDEEESLFWTLAAWLGLVSLVVMAMLVF